LAGLNRYLDREDLVPADIFQAAASEPATPETALRRSEPEPTVEPGPAPAAAGDLEVRIREAYKRLVRRPGGWVGLAELRPLLGDDVGRTDVDRELKRMDRLPGISVIPEENQKTLTPEERDAAVKIGGKDNHLIAIEDA
jgi:hypothetical protein